MTDLAALLERVEKATGPDREIDAEIESYLGDETAFSIHGLPYYTASIDAAVALVERMLPGSRRTSGHFGNDECFCRITDSDTGFGKTEPLAILSVLLKALIQKDPHHD